MKKEEFNKLVNRIETELGISQYGSLALSIANSKDCEEDYEEVFEALKAHNIEVVLNTSITSEIENIIYESYSTASAHVVVKHDDKLWLSRGDYSSYGYGDFSKWMEAESRIKTIIEYVTITD